jgi:hypothetical protein
LIDTAAVNLLEISPASVDEFEDFSEYVGHACAG